MGMIRALAKDKVYDVAVVGSGPAGLVDRGLCGLRRALGRGVRCAGVRRAGRRQRAHRKLPRLSDRHFRAGADGARLQSGAEIRRRHDDSDRGEVARLLARRRRVRPATRRWRGAARQVRGGGERRALSPSRNREPRHDFEGRGVWYWASPIEARLCAEQEIVLVGGGNSAGQAAVFLSGHARRVHMVIRGGGLGASMSRYLIERIEATSNIELVFNTEVVALEGTRRRFARARALAQPAVRRREHDADIRNLFLFVGADPATGWLDGCGVMVDRGGFVVTGRAVQEERRATGIGAGNLGARRVRRRRRALRIGQARRRRDRRRRAGGGGAARFSRRHREAGALKHNASCLGRGQNRVAAEPLRMHVRCSRDLTYALAAEWRIGKGRIEAGNQLADLIFKGFRHLHVMPVRTGGLRQTGGIVFGHCIPCGRIWIFARRCDGKAQFAALTCAMKLRKIFR